MSVEPGDGTWNVSVHTHTHTLSLHHVALESTRKFSSTRLTTKLKYTSQTVHLLKKQDKLDFSLTQMNI